MRSTVLVASVLCGLPCTTVSLRAPALVRAPARWRPVRHACSLGRVPRAVPRLATEPEGEERPERSPDALGDGTATPLGESFVAEGGSVAPPDSAALPILHRTLPQVVLCAAGYLVHVCVLSRRGVRLSSSVDVGLDTIAGCAVLVAAAMRRVGRQRPAIPPWLTGKASEDASECADFGAAPVSERLRLLVTCAGLLIAPFFFSKLAPLIEALALVLALAGLPLNPTRMMSVRLILEQSLLNVALFQLVRMRHPGFFGRQWVRWSTRGPWLAPVLGGYAASLALFNLVEPINQARPSARNPRMLYHPTTTLPSRKHRPTSAAEHAPIAASTFPLARRCCLASTTSPAESSRNWPTPPTDRPRRSPSRPSRRASALRSSRSFSRGPSSCRCRRLASRIHARILSLPRPPARTRSLSVSPTFSPAALAATPQALTAWVPISAALAISGVLFGAQHLQIGLLLPLSVTGYFWGVLYVNSRNLLVPILIHALWNGRIFLGSYLGL